MLIYILSLVFYVYAFFNGFGDENKKGKFITWGCAIVSIINLYRIYSNHISYSLIFNFILSLIHLAALFFSVLFLFASKSKNDNTSDYSKRESKFKETIIDDGRYSNPEVKEYGAEQCQNTSTTNTEFPIDYRNMRVDGHMFDAQGTYSDFKITIHNNGGIYEYYVKGGKIVAYRTDGMMNPKSY